MSTQTIDQTQISRQAPYIEAANKGLLASAKALTDQPYTQYAGQELAPFSTDQMAAFDLTRQGIGSYVPWMAAAGIQAQAAPDVYGAVIPEAQDLMRGATTAYDPTTQTQAYMNPYQQDVIDTTMSELNRQHQIQNQSLNAQAAQSGAFGGARHGVAQAEANRNLSQVQAETLAKLNAQNYTQALGAGMQAHQADRSAQMGTATGLAGLGQVGADVGLRTSSQLAALGGMGQQYLSGDVQMLSQAGSLQQQQLQKGMALDKTRFTEAQMQPYQRLGFYGDVLHGVPTSQSTLTSRTAPTKSATSQMLGGIASIAGTGKDFGWWGESSAAKK